MAVFGLRDLEGRLNSAFLGLFYTSCGPSVSGSVGLLACPLFAGRHRVIIRELLGRAALGTRIQNAPFSCRRNAGVSSHSDERLLCRRRRGPEPRIVQRELAVCAVRAAGGPLDQARAWGRAVEYLGFGLE